MKNQHYHKRSRDLFPKPFSNHYTERFPWKEPDKSEVTWLMIAVGILGFGTCLGIIYLMAWVANHIPKEWDL